MESSQEKLKLIKEIQKKRANMPAEILEFCFEGIQQYGANGELSRELAECLLATGNIPSAINKCTATLKQPIKPSLEREIRSVRFRASIRSESEFEYLAEDFLFLAKAYNTKPKGLKIKRRLIAGLFSISSPAAASQVRKIAGLAGAEDGVLVRALHAKATELDILGEIDWNRIVK